MRSSPVARRIFHVSLVTVPLLAACTPPHEQPAAVLRDSAGVRITESREPLLSGESTWSVGEHPELRIGVLEGAEHYQFTNIAGAWRTNDGRIVVGDRMAREVRIFANDGTFLQAFGRGGDGPGEFRNLTALAPYRADSIITWDSGLKRLSIFDSHGTLGRTVKISLSPLLLGAGERTFGVAESFWGASGNGSIVLSPMKILAYAAGDVPVFRRPLIRLTPTGDSLNSFATFALAESRGPTRPFARMPLVAIGDDEVVIGGEVSEGTNTDIMVWSTSGRLERIVRIIAPPRAVLAKDRESFRAWYRESQRIVDTPAEEIDRELAATDFPVELPRYSGLIIDANGYLWAEEYSLKIDQHPVIWHVFDPSGRWLDQVAMPPQIKIQQIGIDFVLGVRMDEANGIPVIESYQLQRGH